MEQRIDREDLLRSLPAPRTDIQLSDCAHLAQQVDRKVIVLDDDPTGTQTVHGVPVITRWSVAELERELRDAAPATYVLTNSRSLAQAAAVALNREIAENLQQAAANCGRDYLVISRSDSTLRGHFPAEMDTLEAALGKPSDAWILYPFFAEGGRLTINDVHYVAEAEELIPAAMTPFAADAAFGYRHSNLREWIQEKSAGRIAADQVASLSIEALRTCRTEQLAQQLIDLPRGTVCVINAAVDSDLLAAVAAILVAESTGKRFLYRTAASFVAARAGIPSQALLTREEMTTDDGRGVMIVVGSYVPKTTAQLKHLLDHFGPSAFELDVSKLLNSKDRESHIAAVASSASEALAQDRTTVVYTSRKIVQDAGEKSLDTGRSISRALVEVVDRLSQRPRVLVAKGGITSSDLATDACGVTRAIVLGQILPGVPVWRCGADSRYPGMPLVIFPGNVGGPEALTTMLARLTG